MRFSRRRCSLWVWAVSAVAFAAGPVAAQGVNVAVQGVATQSTTGFGGGPERAIDGNTSGVFGEASVSHTDTGDPTPWWEVDLGQEYDIDSIVLWNRTDCCSERLTNFRVSILDSGFDEVFSEDYFPDGLGFPDTSVDGFEIPVDDATGQIVRIELFDTHAGFDPGQYYLSLAEVQVFSTADDIPPLILTQPSGGRANIGDAFTFSVVANGSAPLSYQWYKDDAEIDGATSADLVVDPVALDDAGTYKVVVSNSAGEVESDPVDFVVLEFPNLAIYGTATQSTTGFGGTPDIAIDGDTSGTTFSHTATGDPSPWWELALVGNSTIHSIALWNRTNCCPERLTNFRVVILDAARDEAWSDEFFTDGISYPDTTTGAFSIPIEDPVEGRFVRVEFIEDENRAQNWLSLAEVEVFGEGPTEPVTPNPNLAKGKPAAQNSDYNDVFTADKAVDGNLGNFTHTLSGLGPAIWEVYLEDEKDISIIILHNRGDGCCPSRLRDIVVSIHDVSYLEDDPITDIIDLPLEDVVPLWDSALYESPVLNPENELGGGGTGGPPVLEIRLDEPITGSYVRITRIPDLDLSGTGGQGNADEADVLSLGEVEVYGPLDCPAEGDTTCNGLAVDGPPDNGYGSYTFTADGADASNDVVLYTFRAESEFGDVITAGPQPSNIASMYLSIGSWTVTVEVDDDGLCTDASPNASCTTMIDVIDPVCENEGMCNVALGGVASQSSTGYGGDASRAIDGNTDGNYGAGSISHTNDGDPAPWWEVDLRKSYELESIVLWNRVDCCSARLANFRVSLLDENREEIYSDEFFTDGINFPDTSFEGFEIFLDGEVARYVRIELLGDLFGAGLYLSLAEVQVFGDEIGGPTIAFVRGDADASGTINITDGVFILNFLFQGGGDPPCKDAADVDDTGGINITDGVYVLNFLFQGGGDPPAPWPTCGDDPTEDNVTCDTSHAACL